MATSKFSSREKENVYRLIRLLNSSLQFVVLRLEELAAAKIFDPKYLKELKGITEEVQTEIERALPPQS